MHCLASNAINLLVLFLVLFLIFQSLPRIIGLPIIILILAIVFPNDRLIQALSRMVSQYLGVIILMIIIWYSVLRISRRR